MNNDAIRVMIQKRELEEYLRAECAATLEDRVQRYLTVKPHEIVPETHFAQVSTEVPLLFRDGHFYGAIALSQAVGEAMVRFMCQRNQFRPQKVFERNLERLLSRGFLDGETAARFTELWSGRDDYHHLNPNIEQDRRKVQDLAERKAHVLQEIEKDIFAFAVNNGALVPKYPQYWNDVNEQSHTSVYLRLE